MELIEGIIKNVGQLVCWNQIKFQTIDKLKFHRRKLNNRSIPSALEEVRRMST